MARRTARRVMITREITYHPKNSLAWYRVFRAGWQGPVTDEQYAFLMKEKAATALDDQGADGTSGDGAGNSSEG
ncbi:hypothetical protein [Hyphomonas sp.]|uniref:hypothetical protein n=1 Tax=Hyphomonas sp. TaxID=87 RepID=UPI0025BEE057|nr:hypothetical protein [Hyphomonas sp.]MBI1401453.1 hypothetical protein [Hyphomonas sp.]